LLLLLLFLGEYHDQPRLTAWFGDFQYNYSGLTLHPYQVMHMYMYYMCRPNTPIPRNFVIRYVEWKSQEQVCRGSWVNSNMFVHARFSNTSFDMYKSMHLFCKLLSVWAWGITNVCAEIGLRMCSIPRFPANLVLTFFPLWMARFLESDVNVSCILLNLNNFC